MWTQKRMGEAEWVVWRGLKVAISLKLQKNCCKIGLFVSFDDAVFWEMYKPLCYEVGTTPIFFSNHEHYFSKHRTVTFYPCYWCIRICPRRCILIRTYICFLSLLLITTSLTPQQADTSDSSTAIPPEENLDLLDQLRTQEALYLDVFYFPFFVIILFL